jgi:hypothetical protein
MGLCCSTYDTPPLPVLYPMYCDHPYVRKHGHLYVFSKGVIQSVPLKEAVFVRLEDGTLIGTIRLKGYAGVYIRKIGFYGGTQYPDRGCKKLGVRYFERGMSAENQVKIATLEDFPSFESQDDSTPLLFCVLNESFTGVNPPHYCCRSIASSNYPSATVDVEFMKLLHCSKRL